MTLSWLVRCWFVEPAFSLLVAPRLQQCVVHSPEVSHNASVSIAFGLISFLHIVLGELAPKSIAIRLTETISLWAALPLFLFYWLMYPFIVVLNTSANLVLMSIRLRVADVCEDAHSADEQIGRASCRESV